MGEEQRRLTAAREGRALWKKWGPYLSERQWGTVREDYSTDGSVWDSFSHDQARSRAYHWGEDGLAGFSDDRQRLCFAIALWNGRDPILKERLFGLTNAEGNHGEDVKEYYFYLDSTPTHSYMKWLYKYPQRAFPYGSLVENNRRRSRREFEYELLDTGVFTGDRYFDVYVEYAKAAPEDILIRITAINRGPVIAVLHVLPTLWFRNTWRFWPGTPKPVMSRASGCEQARAIATSHPDLGTRWLYIHGSPPLLFTDNETNAAHLFATPNASAYVKDGIDAYVVHRRKDTVNHKDVGTKAAAHFPGSLGAGQTRVFRLRLTDLAPAVLADPFARFDETCAMRIREADEFYGALTPRSATPDVANVMRQAFAGMLWSKQYYFFDVGRWIEEHRTDRFARSSQSPRNAEWAHMVNADVISLPDKWEYPWYAAWALAFHAIALAGVDSDFAKTQLELLLREPYMHASGQIPACEWNFSDVNPPVHAWAAIFLYRTEQALRGRGDAAFLNRCFGKLLSNFTWWMNRKDRFGRGMLDGGFLGVDQIGMFDRSSPLPTGGHLDQAEAVAWMALFCQNMLEIAAELAIDDQSYEDLAVRFVDTFFAVAQAINHVGDTGMWDEEDGFYYDVLRRPDGGATRLRVRSIVGLLPLCATTVIEPWQRDRLPRLTAHVTECVRRDPALMRHIHPTGEHDRGQFGRGIMALVNPQRLRRILARVLDEREFLAPYGIRALSRVHCEHPYAISIEGQEQRIYYVPAESDSSLFGGNSNWRGPIWMPINVLVLRALIQFYEYYGDAFKVECPTGSGRLMTLIEVAREISGRLVAIFLRDARGRRPVFGGTETFQTDPHWRDHVLFHEYFHGDNGAGLGASHHTGWTGLVATLIEVFGTLDARAFLERGRHAYFSRHETNHRAIAAHA